MRAYERFLKYAVLDTQSAEGADTVPSTEKQFKLAQLLVKELTELGLELATKIYERHNILTKFLTSLGVHEEPASQDACRIEHVLSDEAVEAIKRHIT